MRNRMQKISHSVRAKHGVEIVPNEIPDLLVSAYGTIRKEMVARGYKMFSTMTDKEVRDMCRSAWLAKKDGRW